MLDKVEISSFDLRYESYRLKDPIGEKSLLASICEAGIKEPLQGVDTPEPSKVRILLNGFKRYRCALKLSIGTVPYSSLGSDESFGIITLLRIANSKSLNILEQAKLIDELHKVHKLGVSEMARLLEKSKGWVSMRLGLMEQMSDVVMEKIFNGQFPAYSYMYTLRPFIRMNGIKKEVIEDFVCSTSGKGLSVRDLDTLARGYFSGSADFVEQIKKGDISWVLNHLKEKEAVAGSSDCSELERKVLRELEIIRCYMDKIPFYSSDSRLKSPDYCAQANLAAGKILKNIPAFKQYLEALYDRTREKGCSVSASS